MILVPSSSTVDARRFEAGQGKGRKKPMKEIKDRIGEERQTEAKFLGINKLKQLSRVFIPARQIPTQWHEQENERVFIQSHISHVCYPTVTNLGLLLLSFLRLVFPPGE